MLSKLIAHVVFHFCGAVDDACYYHKKETRVSVCVNVPYFDSTSCPGDGAVTRSFRLRFTSVKFLPIMAEAAARQMPYAASQLTVLSATIPVEMSTMESRSLNAKGE